MRSIPTRRGTLRSRAFAEWFAANEDLSAFDPAEAQAFIQNGRTCSAAGLDVLPPPGPWPKTGAGFGGLTGGSGF